MDLDSAIVSYLQGELSPLASMKIKKIIESNPFAKRKMREWQFYVEKIGSLKTENYSPPEGYQEQLLKKVKRKLPYLPWIGALTLIPGLLLVISIHISRKNKAA